MASRYLRIGLNSWQLVSPSLDTTRQTSFVDQMLDDGPQPAGVMSGKAFRTVVDKVFLQGKYSPLVPDFEKRAAELGYQAQ